MAKDTAHQGCLNLQGLEAVRQVEELEKREEGLIPLKSSIWRECDELLRKVGYPLFKMQRKETVFGELVWLEFECMICFALQNNGLNEIAQEESIEMAFSIDAAELGAGTSHIFGALKMADVHACRRDGTLMFVKDKQDGVHEYYNLQSKKNTYIMIMAFSKDGKQP